MKWKILSSEYLFKDLWFKVRKDKCEMPSGKIVDPYYVYEFTDWVTVVALTEDNKIIMEKQYRHALGEICIELPGGCVDAEDKDFETAALRELIEETGYKPASIEFLGKTSSNPSTNSNLMYFFLAKGSKKIANQDLDFNEEIQVELYDIDDVVKLLKENKIIQSMHVVALHYALEKLGKLKYN